MRPVAARYKVYIIDEVHMLSKQAFNGLLKTLEEPPPHVKFVFATTEIRKVPVTVLSRCQRFDLRRIDSAELAAYLATLAEKEQVKIEEGALALIARAAEGSARDSLSLLDQAIAHGEGDTITTETVRQMLGLADRGRVLDIFEKLMGGKIADALTDLQGLYDAGADPLAVMQDLLETTHFLTRVKVAPAAQGFFDGGSGEARRAAELAAKLSVASLTRAWQVLLKGLFEVRDATRPISACEMALIRLAYAAELPPTDKLVKDLLDGGAVPAPRGGGAPAPSSSSRAPVASGSAMPAPRRCPKARRRPPSALWTTSSPCASRARNCTSISSTMSIWCGWSRAIEIRPNARAPRTLANDLQTKLRAGPANAGRSPSPARAARRPWPSKRQPPRPRALKESRRSRWCAPCWTGFQAPNRGRRAMNRRHAGKDENEKHAIPAHRARRDGRLAMSSGHDGMAAIGSEIERLIQLLSKLPGLGPRSARRAALALLKKRDTLAGTAGGCLARSRRRHPDLRGLRQSRYPVALRHLQRSPTRSAFAVRGGRRRRSVGAGTGRGVPRPLSCAGRRAVGAGRHHAGTAECAALLERVKQSVDEVILAMNATVEGQTTAHYLMDLLGDMKVTRLAHGVPVGGELDYLDEGTLSAAFKARRAL